MGKRVFLCSVLLASAFASAPAVAASTSFPAQKNLHFLSAHPDDTILISGGLLGAINPDEKRIHYHVLANISNYTISGEHNIEETTGIRYLEDIRALDSLLLSNSGIRKYTYSAFNEKDAPLVNMWDADFTTFNTEAIKQFENAYQQISALMEAVSRQGETCAFFVNIGLPNSGEKAHFNHFLLREATLKAVHDLGPQKMTCALYLGEDLPYYIKNIPESEKTIARLKERLRLETITYPIDIEKKMKSVNEYKSQITPNYEYSVRERQKEIGGERVYFIYPDYYLKFHTDPSCNKNKYCDY